MLNKVSGFEHRAENNGSECQAKNNGSKRQTEKVVLNA